MMIHQLEETQLVLSDQPLPDLEDQASQIRSYWENITQKKKRLWNGEFFMFTGVSVGNGILHGTGHKPDFATFIYWRDHARRQGITHITGTTLPSFSDGSLLAVIMADHTANPGKIYFPAGSFDSHDIVQGQFDVVRNVQRELKEEIGLELKQDWINGALQTAQIDNAYHVGLPLRLPMSFDELKGIWQSFRRLDGDDEIESLVQIGSVDEIPLEMPPYAAALCRHHFAGLKD